MKIVLFRYDAEIIITLSSGRMNAAASDGAPQWRIMAKKLKKTRASPCLGESLRRESFV